MAESSSGKVRNLVLVLGDQLDRQAAAFDSFDPSQDAVWMAENHEEATYVWSHKLRLVFFFSAMRHFRDELREKQGYKVHYHELSRRKSDDRGGSFSEILRRDLKRLSPDKAIVVQPGDYRVQEALKHITQETGIDLEIREDRHFYSSPEDFRDWAQGRKTLILETFYRRMRKKHKVLIDQKGKPEGGEWNLDEDNRQTFGSDGPPEHKAPRRFAPDETTRAVQEMIEARFGDHPGHTTELDLPVTHEDARAFLRDFVKHRLKLFGDYEDALWTGEDFLYHSRLSALLNVKLLSPREVVDKVLEAYDAGQAPINSVEGFVRQVLGWREFVRGIYWLHMPDYAEMNALGAEEDVPPFFWDGKTDMRCVAETMRNILQHGYAHHIQRLMVMGLFAQLYGVHPHKFHEWHMAMYIDAIDWVSLPNALGMSQYGDGGIMGTKPYCATGNYINKMSNYCKNCRYNHRQTTGDNACPFTTLYYDFLDRHRSKFEDNNRMNFQMRNLDRKSDDEMKDIRRRAKEIRHQQFGKEGGTAELPLL